MTSRPFRMIDVVPSAVPQSGNRLAVVLDAEGLAAEQMAAFSAWTILSECTFVLPPTDPAADYRVRIFSLTTELPFAGHPMLGTARAWLDAGGVPRTPGRVVQECGLGVVPVRIDDDALAVDRDVPACRQGARSVDRRDVAGLEECDRQEATLARAGLAAVLVAGPQGWRCGKGGTSPSARATSGEEGPSIAPDNLKGTRPSRNGCARHSRRPASRARHGKMGSMPR